MRQRPGEPQRNPPSRQSSSISRAGHNPPKKPPRAASFMPKRNVSSDVIAHHLGRTNDSSTTPPRKASQSKRKRTATPPRSLRAATSGTQKQNNGRVCNFFAIRNCSSSPIAVQDVKTAGNQPYSSLFARPRDGKESLIAKKLLKVGFFVFQQADLSQQAYSTMKHPRKPSGPHITATGQSQRRGMDAIHGLYSFPIRCF